LIASKRECEISRKWRAITARLKILRLTTRALDSAKAAVGFCFDRSGWCAA
jgi:hypothetical protein